MIIKSKFKDYYDHVAHLYGGGDPNILYIRGKIKTENLLVQTSDAIKRGNYNHYHGVWKNYETQWISVVGKYYMLIRRNEYDIRGEWKLINEKDFPDQYAEYIKPRPTTSWNKDVDQNRGGMDKVLAEISRKIQEPVFSFELYSTYNSRHVAHISENIPILGDLGFASVIPPEQMYQDIEFFMTNVLRESPDTKIPVIISDKDRIIQHGFDLKQSFRHRK